MSEQETSAKALATFGRNIVAMRGAKGWSVAELCRRSGLPLDLIKQYERGQTSAPLEHMRMIAGAFGVPVSKLVGLRD